MSKHFRKREARASRGQPKSDSLEDEQTTQGSSSGATPSHPLLHDADNAIKDVCGALKLILSPALHDCLDPTIIAISSSKKLITWLKLFRSVFYENDIRLIIDKIIRFTASPSLAPAITASHISRLASGRRLLSPLESLIVLDKIRRSITSLVDGYHFLSNTATDEKVHQFCGSVVDRLMRVEALDLMIKNCRAEPFWPPLPSIDNDEMRNSALAIGSEVHPETVCNNKRLKLVGQIYLNDATGRFMSESNISYAYSNNPQFIGKVKLYLSSDETFEEWAGYYQLAERAYTEETLGQVQASRLFKAHVGALLIEKGIEFLDKWLFRLFCAWLSIGIENTVYGDCPSTELRKNRPRKGKRQRQLIREERAAQSSSASSSLTTATVASEVDMEDGAAVTIPRIE